MLTWLVFIVGGWSAAAVGLVWWGRTRRPPEYADAIVVAGCLVHPDGTPTTALRQRASTAVSLWRVGHAPVILFTGGSKRGRPTEAARRTRPHQRRD